MDDQAAWDALIRRLRAATRRDDDPTEAETIGYFADWWEALSAEIDACWSDQTHGGPNHRLSTDDLQYARGMAAWTRHDSLYSAWKESKENREALGRARQAAAQAGSEQGAKERALATLSDADKTRLATRPAPPDKRDSPIVRPRNYLPIGWPPIRPKTPWSVYIGELLTELRARAGIADREPGEDREEDDDAAQ